jgi:rod shape determining protein RodA
MRPTSGPISAITSRSEAAGASLAHLAEVRWGLLAATLLLAAIGLATVHSASSELATDYLPRQLVWVAVGLVLLLVSMSVDYHALVGLAIPFYGLGLLLLVIVLLAGHEAGGARAWLGIGAWRIQPSEFAKLATALLLARHLGRVKQRHLNLRQIAVAVAIAAVPMALVAVEPDLGGAAMFVPMLLGMLIVAGVRVRILAAFTLVFVLGAAATWTFGMQDYQRQRVATFLRPESDPLGAGYQVRQSKIAVGSGEFLGRGYMQGTQSQLRFLPARHTDFVFAVLAEEWGFLGVATALALYGFYIANGAEVAMRARDRLGVLLVVGVLAVIAFHVLYNTAMVVGLVPITGIPLPFLSYGGSFMLVNFIATGIILGVDYRRYVNR